MVVCGKNFLKKWINIIAVSWNTINLPQNNNFISLELQDIHKLVEQNIKTDIFCHFACDDFINPDRVVMGTTDKKSEELLRIKGFINKEYSNIYAYDLLVVDIFRMSYDYEIVYCQSLQEPHDTCDVFVMLNAWDKFKSSILFNDKSLIDARYCLA